MGDGEGNVDYPISITDFHCRLPIADFHYPLAISIADCRCLCHCLLPIPRLPISRSPSSSSSSPTATSPRLPLGRQIVGGVARVIGGVGRVGVPGRPRLLPVLDNVRRLAGEVEPCDRLGESRAMVHASRDPGRQVRIAQAGQQLQQLTQALEILPRDGEHPEAGAISVAVAATMLGVAALRDPQGHQHRSEEHQVRQIGRWRLESLAEPVEARQ